MSSLKDSPAIHSEFVLERLNKGIALSSPSSMVVKLSRAGTHTIKTKDGGYFRRSFMGGEMFRLIGAYMGKRGKAIYRFRPESLASEDYAELEVPANQLDSIVGFSAARDKALKMADFSDDKFDDSPPWLEPDDKELASKVAAPSEPAKSKEQEAYGESWGLFA